MSSRQNGMDAVKEQDRPAGTITPPQKWVNAGPDEGALPALLDRIIERVPRERIDVLWIFPPRLAGGVESTVIVIAGFDDDVERRTVATAHFRVTRDKRGRAGVALQMQEHGSAPLGATQRVVDGVLRRLGDEVGREAPRRVEIAGAAASWWELYADVGGDVPDEMPAGPTTPAEGASEETLEGSATPAGDAPQDTEQDQPVHDAGESAPFRGDGPDGDEQEQFERDDGESTPPHGDVLDDVTDRA